MSTWTVMCRALRLWLERHRTKAEAHLAVSPWSVACMTPKAATTITAPGCSHDYWNDIPSFHPSSVAHILFFFLRMRPMARSADRCEAPLTPQSATIRLLHGLGDVSFGTARTREGRPVPVSNGFSLLPLLFIFSLGVLYGPFSRASFSRWGGPLSLSSCFLPFPLFPAASKHSLILHLPRR